MSEELSEVKTFLKEDYEDYPKNFEESFSKWSYREI